MNTLEERMRVALALACIGKADLARRVGVTSSAVSCWCNGSTRTLEGKNLIRVACVLGVSPSWLATGRGGREQLLRPEAARQENLSHVEVMPMSLVRHGGAGGLGWVVDELGARNQYRRDWCAEKGYDPTSLAMQLVADASMAPTIPQGACVTINTVDVAPRNGKVFALDYRGEFLVRRLSIEPCGSLRVVADSTDKVRYRDIIATPEHMHVIRILGRVVAQTADVD